METILSIHPDGVIYSLDIAPNKEHRRLELKPATEIPPKPSTEPLEIRYQEREEWYLVSDGVVFTRR
jgi:hypothetical protein